MDNDGCPHAKDYDGVTQEFVTVAIEDDLNTWGVGLNWGRLGQTGTELHRLSVLKSGLVWSFTPILRQPDCNWSFDFPDLRQPDQDHSRPVHVGPHSGPNWLQLVFTKTSPRLVHNQFKVIFMKININ